MENRYYTVEKGQQILVSLLKQHGIRKVIASPGTTNITFVACLQYDDFFEVYSSVDERSAAYQAVGLAEESGEPVVLTCTGATASRNYIPGLTEAFYRKLPILAVTATQNENRIGNLVPQMMDRSQQLKDMCVHSEHIAIPRNTNDEWDANLRLNRAILALTHRGGGPVHINLATEYNNDFSVKELPVAKCIRRYTHRDVFPDLPNGRIAILVGNHKVWSKSLVNLVDAFCEAYGAVVFCEHGGNYTGKYRVYNSILSQQTRCNKSCFENELTIHIGEVSSYGIDSIGYSAKYVWRVNEDGELRDRYMKLSNVFEMTEEEFFSLYIKKANTNNKEKAEKWLRECKSIYDELHSLIPDSLPFSNVWLAQQTAHRLPENSVLHMGILNSHRAWTMFELPKSIQGQCFVNTGGFGIDGCMSSMIGGALAHPDKIHFLIIGDLAFFYDLNSLGLRHIGNNVRILLVNNGKGTEFRNYNHLAAQFGEDADEFMAAARHNGNKSPELIKHFAQYLGFEYMSASSKEEYLSCIDKFINPEVSSSPMLFEVFTTNEEESKALEIINTLKENPKTIKQMVRNVLPDCIVKAAKTIIRK